MLYILKLWNLVTIHKTILPAPVIWLIDGGLEGLGGDNDALLGIVKQRRQDSIVGIQQFELDGM